MFGKMEIGTRAFPQSFRRRFFAAVHFRVLKEYLWGAVLGVDFPNWEKGGGERSRRDSPAADNLFMSANEPQSCWPRGEACRGAAEHGRRLWPEGPLRIFGGGLTRPAPRTPLRKGLAFAGLNRDQFGNR